MLKRTGVVMAAAVLGVVALTVPASSQPEPRFTLQINPTQGPVGTNIHAQLPAEATAVGGECLSPSDIFASLQQVAGAVIAQGNPSPAVQDLLNAIQDADNLQELGPDAIDLTLFFILVFADPATQRPAIDQTTGQESATSFWDPVTGQGDVTAPPTERPKTYLVAGVCLDLNTNPDPAALAGAVQQIIDNGISGPEAIDQAATALLTPLINQDAKVAWVAPFCLLGDNGETCAGPTAAAAEPVAGEPAFTG